MLKSDQEIIRSNSMLTPAQKEMQLKNFESTKKTFESLLEESAHQNLIKTGERRLSQKATLNALFILLYRDEPILFQPFKFITALMDIDENFTTWRQRHAIMAQRMLGTKIGTGGSSGHEYLKRAAEEHRIYNDLFNLSTFLIPRSKLPKLPENLKKNLNFFQAP